MQVRLVKKADVEEPTKEQQKQHPREWVKEHRKTKQAAKPQEQWRKLWA